MSSRPPGRVTAQIDGQVGRVVLEHHGKHNAVNGLMWEQLAQVVTELGEGTHGQVRVVVITGHGDTFSSGADLRELHAATRDEQLATEFSLRVVRALSAIARCPIPTIASLRKHVTGGGAEIALATDLRIAQEDAVFQIPMGSLGVVPDHLTLRRLIDIAGPGAARRVLLARQQLGAPECLRLGLFDHVVPMGELDDATEELVGSILASSEYSVRATKELILSFEHTWEDESLIAEMVESLLHGGVRENAAAFLRRPRRSS